MKRIFSVIVIMISSLWMSQNAQANNKDVISWTFEAQQLSDDTYEVVLTANVLNPEWHFWTMNPGNEMLIPTQINFEPSSAFEKVGAFDIEGKTISTEDEIFGAIQYYEGDVVFKHKIKSEAGKKIEGAVVYQACNASTCLAPKEIPFSIVLP